jgi:hypothetical protein
MRDNERFVCDLCETADDPDYCELRRIPGITDEQLVHLRLKARLGCSHSIQRFLRNISWCDVRPGQIGDSHVDESLRLACDLLRSLSEHIEAWSKIQ